VVAEAWMHQVGISLGYWHI